VSRAGQAPDGREDPGTAVFVADFPMPPGTRFDWHTHEDHQLAWATNRGAQRPDRRGNLGAADD